MDTGKIPKGKRKKANSACPNKLFIFWLTELRDDAAEKGLNSQYSYGKALKSLQKFPLALPNGKACKMLENFGDKTCVILDQKLEQHIERYGSAEILPDEVKAMFPETPQRRKKIPAQARGQPRGQTGGRVGGQAGSPQTKGGRATTPRKRGEYLPQPGSGTYAILLTLFKSSDKDAKTGLDCMLKQDLMDTAQPLADKSFSIADPGCRYTAWSSMSTLTRKGFVIKQGCPAKYSLTPAGVDLALKLLDLDGDPTSDTDHPRVNTYPAPARDPEFRLPTLPTLPPPDRFPSSPTYTAPRLGSLSDSSDDQLGGLVKSPPVVPFTGQGYRLGSAGGTPKKSPYVKKVGGSGKSKKGKASFTSVASPAARRKINIQRVDHDISDSSEDELPVKPYSNARRRSVASPSTTSRFGSSDWSQAGRGGGGGRQNTNTAVFTLSSDDDDDDILIKPTLSSSTPATRCPSPKLPMHSVKAHDMSDESDDELPSLASRLGGSPVPRRTAPVSRITAPVSHTSVPVSHTAAPASHAKPQASQEDSSFRFAYVGENGDEVSQKDKAEVTIDDDLGGLGFRIKCFYTDLIMTNKLYNMDHTKIGNDGYSYFFLADKDAPDRAPGLTPPSPPPSKKRPSPDPEYQNHHDYNPTSIPIQSPCKKRRMATATISRPEDDYQEYQFKMTKDSEKENGLQSAINLPVKSASTSSMTSTGPKNVEQKDKWSFLSYKSGGSKGDGLGGPLTSSVTGSDVTSQGPVDDRPLFTLAPGSFDVILCVDKREHYGGAKSSKQLLMPELQKNQMKFELRQLALGDFAWIARPKGSPEGEKEIIFDHIVERKRMDDLAGSIQDGRFKEQKVEKDGGEMVQASNELDSRSDRENVPDSGQPLDNTKAKSVQAKKKCQEDKNTNGHNKSRSALNSSKSGQTLTKSRDNSLKSLGEKTVTKMDSWLIRRPMDEGGVKCGQNPAPNSGINSQKTMEILSNEQTNGEKETGRETDIGTHANTRLECISRSENGSGGRQAFTSGSRGGSVGAQSFTSGSDAGTFGESFDISAGSEQILADLCLQLEQDLVTDKTFTDKNTQINSTKISTTFPWKPDSKLIMSADALDKLPIQNSEQHSGKNALTTGPSKVQRKHENGENNESVTTAVQKCDVVYGKDINGTSLSCTVSENVAFPQNHAVVMDRQAPKAESQISTSISGLKEQTSGLEKDTLNQKQMNSECLDTNLMLRNGGSDVKSEPQIGTGSLGILTEKNSSSKRPVLEMVEGFKQLTLGDQGFNTPDSLHHKSLYKPLVEPKLERLTIDKYELVFFDIEATGLATSSHIVQLAASGPWGTFNRYVKPDQGMHPDAAAVTGIRYFKGRLFHNGRQVYALPIQTCLKQFLKFLPKKNAILIGHNAHGYDSRVLLNAAVSCNLHDDFESKISGFVDTLPLFREKYPDLGTKYTQEELVKRFVGEDYQAHNAKADASALKKLVRHCEITRQELLSHSLTSRYVMGMIKYECKKKRRVESYRVMGGGVLSSGVIGKAAGVGIRYKDIVKTYREAGPDAVCRLFTEPNTNGKPKVTKSKAILNSLLTYLKDNYD